MGLSKKKFKKGIKSTFEGNQALLEDVHDRTNNEARQKEIGSKELFTTNTKKEGLKEKREKLKADRFKQIEYNTTSKVEEKLVKRYSTRQTRREAKGLEPIPKRQKVQNRTEKMDDDDLGDLADIWATPKEIKSLEFAKWQENFAKKDAHKVKTVMVPSGGQSYNPSIKEHKRLLKDVVKVEEKQVETELKDLKKLRPFQYGYTIEGVEVDESGQPKPLEYDSEVDSSEEEIDMNAPISLNKPVSRLDIKSATQRSKLLLNKNKQRLIKQELRKKKLLKDYERLPNLEKQAIEEAEYFKRKTNNKYRAIDQEISH